MDQPPTTQKPSQPRLTEIAHAAVCRHLAPGAYTIDATLGNGHDTLFLARHVGPNGHVHGFDIQPQALRSTRQRLEEAGLPHLVTLHLYGHEKMKDSLPPGLEGNASAILFNLGFLPGGDKSVTTQVVPTLDALRQAWDIFLSPEGILSILAYPGHPAGLPEAEAVRDWLGKLEGADIRSHPSPGPELHLVTKK